MDNDDEKGQERKDEKAETDAKKMEDIFTKKLNKFKDELKEEISRINKSFSSLIEKEVRRFNRKDFITIFGVVLAICSIVIGIRTLSIKTHKIESDVKKVDDRVGLIDSRVEGVDSRIKNVEKKVSAFSLKIIDPENNSPVDLNHFVRGVTPFPDLNHYLVVTPLETGDDYIQNGPLKVSKSGLWSGRAVFGEVDVGVGEQFSVRVFATKASLSPGPLTRVPGDTEFSESIIVIRKK